MEPASGAGQGASTRRDSRRPAETRSERRARRAAVDDPAVVLEAAARFLEVRPRSVAEVRRRLRDAGYRPELVEGAVERMLTLGYLDDAAFARTWVESRDRARPRGARALRDELRRKGVAPADIEAALAVREATAAGERRRGSVGRAGGRRPRRLAGLRRGRRRTAPRPARRGRAARARPAQAPGEGVRAARAQRLRPGGVRGGSPRRGWRRGSPSPTRSGARPVADIPRRNPPRRDPRLTLSAPGRTLRATRSSSRPVATHLPSGEPTPASGPARNWRHRPGDRRLPRDTRGRAPAAREARAHHGQPRRRGGGPRSGHRRRPGRRLPGPRRSGPPSPCGPRRTRRPGSWPRPGPSRRS